jgi:hypothetical protein
MVALPDTLSLATYWSSCCAVDSLHQRVYGCCHISMCGYVCVLAGMSTAVHEVNGARCCGNSYCMHVPMMCIALNDFVTYAPCCTAALRAAATHRTFCEGNKCNSVLVQLCSPCWRMRSSAFANALKHTVGLHTDALCGLGTDHNA